MMTARIIAAYAQDYSEAFALDDVSPPYTIPKSDVWPRIMLREQDPRPGSDAGDVVAVWTTLDDHNVAGPWSASDDAGLIVLLPGLMAPADGPHEVKAVVTWMDETTSEHSGSFIVGVEPEEQADG